MKVAKVGDRVRYTGNYKYNIPQFIGRIGVVTKVTNGYGTRFYYHVLFDDGKTLEDEYIAENFEILEENKQDFKSIFVETKTCVAKKIDARLSNYALISVMPAGDSIDLVIGASYENKRGCFFAKKHLSELIAHLQEIEKAME